MTISGTVRGRLEKAAMTGAALWLLAACGNSGDDAPADMAAADLGFGERCAALETLGGGALPDASTGITARLREAGAADGQAEMPRHCEVLGRLQERQGMDGQTYAINFRMRLPEDWNGRYLYEGSGGGNGDVSAAVGPATGGAASALMAGYAVLNQDGGHSNATNADPARQGQSAFGHDFEARRNYGYGSFEVAARTGKTLVSHLYGRAAERSYFAGCSNGGREGMMFAQRFPLMFDGIVAAAPGFSLPLAAVAQAWDTQAFARAADALGVLDGAGRPEINKLFSDEDLALVSDAVLEACDELDGLEDGVIGAFLSCTEARVAGALEARLCAGEAAGDCLLPEQVTALKAVYGGARNSAGEALYAAFPWDRGMGGRLPQGFDQGWRVWKLGAHEGQPAHGINVVLGAASLSAIFITPPEVISADPAEGLDFLLAFDFDEDTPKIHATDANFPESAWDMIAARSANLSAFRANGGKIVVPHGVSDPVFSINDTLAWWDEVDEREGGDAAGFARVFPVPGMTHCAGGAATDRYDALAAVVAWVEEGRAPDSIPAAAGDNTPWPGRTRPLCPYPGVATYTGEGSIDEADNFTCE